MKQKPIYPVIKVKKWKVIYILFSIIEKNLRFVETYIRFFLLELGHQNFFYVCVFFNEMLKDDTGRF